ncbi:MAG TPA: sialidase [Planctomycetaceae bacterium]|nr:sialidase [Planctomycetaceae bacterium]
MLKSLPIFVCSITAAVVFADDAVIKSEFIYDKAPFPQCHASTLAESPDGLVIAWFGGTREKHPDVGIWVSRQTGDGWTAPVEVANGIQYQRPGTTPHRHPTWNPVLFQYPNGPLHLYYKCGPTPSTWWGMRTESKDNGATWSTPVRLPEHIDGPVRNKPILLKNGTLLSGSSTEFDGWRLHFEFTSDRGLSYTRTDAIHDGKTFGAIQPTLLVHKNGNIQSLNRNQNGRGGILTTTSADQGLNWSPLKEIDLPNPNSGIDAVTLQDGRFLLVYNHTHRGGDFPQGRNMLNIAVSEDGIKWHAALTLEREPRSEFSYPAVIQTADGKVHTTYTHKRTRIKHVTIDPQHLTLKPIRDGEWPK